MKNTLVYFLFFISLHGFAQQKNSISVSEQLFKLPDIPKFDSIYVDSYNGNISKKLFFLKGKKIFEIGYNTGSVLHSPFFAFGQAAEDSCYAYFNGLKLDNYDFYYMAKSYIINEKYSETSKIFKYFKFDWNKVPIEQGDYYFIKEMNRNTISHYKKYKIGKWIKYDSIGKPTEIFDYANFTLNGNSVKFIGGLEIIDSLKALSDNKIIDVYGKNFFSKYVRFNSDRSGYYSYEDMVPEEKFFPLLYPTANKVKFVDLSYDIVIDDDRFNILRFRISRSGKFLGKTYFPAYLRYFYLSQGLDSSNKGEFHENILNWKTIAAKKDFDINNKSFNVRFDFKPTSDSFGELRLVLEQVIETYTSKNSFTNKLKQYYINPWTGEIKESTDEQGYQLVF